jgi:4-hydroxythreonine-4-phosphate dehydrogenase
MRCAFTCGDVNGIGPEIVAKVLSRLSTRARPSEKILYFAPRNVFHDTADRLGVTIPHEIVRDRLAVSEDPSVVSVVDLGTARRAPGKPTKTSGKYAVAALEGVVEGLTAGDIDAVVTAPISKAAARLAGFEFPGHTEFFAERAGVKDFAMTFLGKRMKAALATIHEPLRRVPDLITKGSLRRLLDVLVASLRTDFGVADPSVAVLGVNPHAGEGGVIGEEERETITPVLREYRGVCEGPFPADAFFARNRQREFDMVVGMYHDQALVPFKSIERGTGVNYTAGLPFVRTSPDHGTAYDLADKGVADETSLFEAYRLALAIARRRRRAQ